MSSSQKKKNKNILIIDDEADVLDFLKIYLESLGWSVFTAATAADGNAMLRSTPFFLVLTDIAMPDMDGYEFISRMRREKIPSCVALMTGFGYNPKHTLVKIYKTRRHPCLFKPFNRQKLVEVVQESYATYHADL